MERRTYRMADCYAFGSNIEEKLGLTPDERIVSVVDLEPRMGRALFLIEKTVRLPASRILRRKRK